LKIYEILKLAGIFECESIFRKHEVYNFIVAC
jgi:hypothetical protein